MFLKNGDELQQDMNLAVEIIPDARSLPSFRCSFCAKVYLSKSRFDRYTNTKYHLETAEPNINIDITLHLDIFYQILQKSLKKLAQECYSDEV